LFLFFFYGVGDHRDLPSFPTRRSSDLVDRSRQVGVTDHGIGRQDERAHPGPSFPARQFPELAHARSQARVWLTVHMADDTLNLSVPLRPELRELNHEGGGSCLVGRERVHCCQPVLKKRVGPRVTALDVEDATTGALITNVTGFGDGGSSSSWRNAMGATAVCTHAPTTAKQKRQRRICMARRYTEATEATSPA